MRVVVILRVAVPLRWLSELTLSLQAAVSESEISRICTDESPLAGAFG